MFGFLAAGKRWGPSRWNRWRRLEQRGEGQLVNNWCRWLDLGGPAGAALTGAWWGSWGNHGSSLWGNWRTC